MDLSWQPEPDDYADAFRARRTSRQARSGFRGYVIRILYAIDVLAGVAFALFGNYAGAFDCLVVLAYFGFLAWFYARRNRRPDAYRKLAAKLWARNERLRLPSHASILTDGIQTGDAKGTVLRDWSHILQIIESDRSMVLILDGENAANLTSRLVLALGVKACLPIPKRGLADPGRLTELRALLIEGVSGRYATTPGFLPTVGADAETAGQA